MSDYCGEDFEHEFHEYAALIERWQRDRMMAEGFTTEEIEFIMNFPPPPVGGFLMLYGDQSNQLPPRMLIVFEGVLAILPAERTAKFNRAVALHRYRRAVECFECNRHAIAVVWDWTWRRDVKVAGVRCGPECANSRLGASKWPTPRTSSSPR